ncbi:MAG: DUF5664 domain-containing protein [Alphaproteobacteria bacterium]|nr:DUF5664 domain-containing protein [Alphaproteobacteria bacterium]
MISGQGKMEDVGSGAMRESNLHRGRFDLLPYEAMEALAIWYELGAEKYAARNWEKGLSVSDCINRMTRHALKVCSGWTDEDHLAAVMWNAAGAITMMQRRPDLNDHAWHTSTEEDKFWREQEKELEEKYRFFLDHLPEDQAHTPIETVEFYGDDPEKPILTLTKDLERVEQTEKQDEGDEKPRTLSDSLDALTKALAKMAIGDISFDGPLNCSDKKAEPATDSWLDDIADLSEEDVEKIRLYSTSGIFTINELRVIIRALAQRNVEIFERSQKAYDEIMKEMRNNE